MRGVECFWALLCPEALGIGSSVALKDKESNASQNIAHLGHINALTEPYFDLPLPLLPTRSNFYGSKWLVQVS